MAQMDEGGGWLEGILFAHWIGKEKLNGNSDLIRNRFKLLSGGSLFEQPLITHELLFAPINNEDSSI
jgi:hypothetical protein